MNDLSFAHISLLAEISLFAVTRSYNSGQALRFASGGLGRQLAHFANLPTSLIIKRETCL